MADKWAALGMGAMRIPPEDYWLMRPCDFGRAVRGFYEHEGLRDSRNWRYFRELMAIIYNMNRDSKSRALKGRDFIRLEGDPIRVIHKFTDEEDAEMRDRITRALNKYEEEHHGS